MSQKNFLDKRGLTYFYDKINSSYLIKYQNMSTNKTDLAIIATKYDSTSTYSIGDYCVYQEKLYKCSTNIETAEAWNEQHWIEVTISDELENIYNLFEDVLLKPQVSGTQGQVLTADGQGGQSWEDSIASGIAASDTNEDGNIIINNTVNVELDEIPTENSVNGVTSGGVYNALSDYVQKTDYANWETAGIARTGASYGVDINANTHVLFLSRATSEQIKNGADGYKPIVPYQQHESTFYGLAKAAGDTTQSVSNNAVGTYTDEAKTLIRSMLGTVGTADWAGVDTSGVVMLDNAGNYGIYMTSGHYLRIYQAADVDIKNGVNAYRPITGAKQHQAVFYGLAKAAGDITQSTSDNTVGTYTDGAKTAIRSMIGAVGDVQVNGTSVITNNTANIPVATANNYGVVLIGNGLQISSSSGKLMTLPAGSSQIKVGSESFMQITPNTQHQSVFYGLAKSAGDTSQANSDNAVGTYTDSAKSAIRTMLGAVGETDYASNSKAGIVGIDDPTNGIGISSANNLIIRKASSAYIKNGTNNYSPIVPYNQHESVFYGLAKVAGDTTQSSSSNTVGTYTDSAKDAIKSMLGIDFASGNIQNVSGTTPTITGEPNARYICGEVATIDIIPPASGTIIVRFTSGSTAAVLTLPNTVKMPEWFDALSLEADTIYELSITDGVYGAVMSWAV